MKLWLSMGISWWQKNENLFKREWFYQKLWFHDESIMFKSVESFIFFARIQWGFEHYFFRTGGVKTDVFPFSNGWRSITRYFDDSWLEKPPQGMNSVCFREFLTIQTAGYKWPCSLSKTWTSWTVKVWFPRWDQNFETQWKLRFHILVMQIFFDFSDNSQGFPESPCHSYSSIFFRQGSELPPWPRWFDAGSLDAFDVAPPGFPGISSREVV